MLDPHRVKYISAVHIVSMFSYFCPRPSSTLAPAKGIIDYGPFIRMHVCTSTPNCLLPHGVEPMITPRSWTKRVVATLNQKLPRVQTGSMCTTFLLLHVSGQAQGCDGANTQQGVSSEFHNRLVDNSILHFANITRGIRISRPRRTTRSVKLVLRAYLVYTTKVASGSNGVKSTELLFKG